MSVSQLTGQHEALGDARTKPAAERETDVLNDLLQPLDASHEGWQDAIRKPFDVAFPPAGSRVVPEASYDDLVCDAPATERTAPVAA